MDELSIVTLAAAKKYTDEHGGGGGGGTSNYNQLENKPQIAGVTLQGNKSLADLGIASSTDLANKVDKETGKGLSTNDYTNTDKAIVDGVTAALSGKQDALTAGLYIEFDGNEISVKRDITQTAQEIAYNFTIPSDFTLRVKKYVNSDLVDTTDYTWNSVTDPINLDSIMEVSKKAGNYWVVKNLIASTTQAADYSVDLYAMQQATDYTQNFVATIDADKKLIIQSELDAALADKVDKVTGKGLSKNDYTDADKAKVDASLNVFTGTQAEWAALSTAEKKTYQRADFTDDYDNTAVGDLTALHTSAKSSIVNAINEVADGKQNITDNNLQTTAKTIVGGINEVKSGLTNYKTVIGYDEVYNQWDELWEVGSIDTTTGVAFFYGSNKAFISQSSTNVWQTFTTPANAYYMRFRLSSDYGTTYNNDVSVNYPATVTSYYPYHGVVDARLDNLANPLGTYNVMGIFQTSRLYNNSYGIAVVTGFDPSIHTATINSASTLDGTNLTLTYNPHSTKKGVVGFFVADAAVLGKIVNINITVS